MTAPKDVIQEFGFTPRRQLVRPDANGRVMLQDAVCGIHYRVLVNERGQVLLDPVTALPAHEAWLWQTPAVRGSMDRALEQASRNDFHDLGSFAADEPS